MPAFSVTSVGGSNTNTLGSEAVNISRSADGDLQISYAGSLASISRDQIPQGYANFKIDRNAVANLAKVIESLKEINAESCPPKYFPAEIGSPTVRKNYYFYLWLATKALAKSGDPINSDCNKLGTIFKARVNAMDKIGELEKDLENKIKGNTGDYVNMQKILTLINDGSLPMNDSDKVTVLVALHYLICCAPNTNFDQRYGSLFLSTAFDISAPAIKALCDILNKDSQALKNVSERIFSVDQQNKLQIIQALYQNSKEGNYVIGQDLRRREQYTAAENLFAKQYESYIVESRKGLPTAELKKIDQKFDEEIEKITKQTNVAIAKETNPKLKELIAGQGTIKIHQAEKQRAITVLDKYFELKPKSANNNDREAREAFMAFKNMSDPLDEWLTVTDANAAIGKEILKEVAIITASSLAGNVVAGAGSRLVLLGARVSRSPVAMAKITAALVSFSLSAGTFTTVENLLSKNPNWSKEHYLNTFIMFAVLAGAGQVGRVMETSTGKRLAKMFEPQLEKIFSSKILTASMNITLRGLPKGLSFSESALSLSLYQIASTPELAQQLMQAMLSSNPNSNVSVMDIMGQVISNNVVFLMGLKTAGALTSIPMIKAKLAETPALQSKLDRVVAEYEAAKIVTVEKRKESFSDLLKVLSDVLEIEPVNESKITPAQMAVLHEFVMDLQLHADNGGKEVSPNRIYELLQDMTHRLLTSNERHTRTILREMLPSMKETIGVDEIYIYEAEPYVSKFSFFNRGISSEKIEKKKHLQQILKN